jgi:Putative beta-barrel porin 2
MTPKVLASCAVVAAVLVARASSAQIQYTGQPDSPQWLKDRKYNEGIGYRTGDLELHPSIAGEVGYDSNWMLRTSRASCGPPSTPCINGPPTAPVISALEFRITPALYLSTLSQQRREGDVGGSLPATAFRFGVSATYREFVGLQNNSSGAGDISQQRNVSLAADTRLDLAPGRPVGGSLFASYGRVIQPNAASIDPNFAFNRDDIGAGADLAIQPGSGTLDWHFGYQIRTAFFEESNGRGFDDITHEVSTRGRWKFRPRTALLSDTTLRFITYTNAGDAASQGLVDSTPVRSRLGLNGLITERFAALVLAGWASSFYRITPQKQYDSFIGQAELKWFLAASPGVAAATDVGLALSTITVGYARDFQNSYLGNYYGSDRGYLQLAYFFASRVVLTFDGGLGAIEYPQMFWADGVSRHSGFTDLRADATAFGEYRFTSTVGLNATLRYTANVSNVHNMPVVELMPNQTPPPLSIFDMSWNRFEAFIGLRWFM